MQYREEMQRLAIATDLFYCLVFVRCFPES